MALEELTKFIDIPISTIRLQSGRLAFATEKETIKVDEHLILHNFFYVPRLTYNLVSMS